VENNDIKIINYSQQRLIPNAGFRMFASGSARRQRFVSVDRNATTQSRTGHSRERLQHILKPTI